LRVFLPHEYAEMSEEQCQEYLNSIPLPLMQMVVEHNQITAEQYEV